MGHEGPLRKTQTHFPLATYIQTYAKETYRRRL